MSFGKNPYLAKAEAAELKASDAPDPVAQARAYREAAHEWERAAGREPPGKRRVEFQENAARNRALADGDVQLEQTAVEGRGSAREQNQSEDTGPSAQAGKKSLLN